MRAKSSEDWSPSHQYVVLVYLFCPRFRIETPKTVLSMLNMPIIIPGLSEAVPSIRRGLIFSIFFLVDSLKYFRSMFASISAGICVRSFMLLLSNMYPFPNLAILLENIIGAMLKTFLNHSGWFLVMYVIIARNIRGFWFSFHLVLSPVIVKESSVSCELVIIFLTTFANLAFFSFPPTGSPDCSSFSQMLLASVSTKYTNPLICIPGVAIARLFNLPLSASFVIVFNVSALIK